MNVSVLNQAHAGRRPARDWFLEITFVRDVGMLARARACVCVCVCACVRVCVCVCVLRCVVCVPLCDNICIVLHFIQQPAVVGTELLYFADICAGPGGFSEYVLWRRKWHAKGFGLTLRGMF